MEAVQAVLHRYINETLLDGNSDELDANTPLLEWGVIDSLSMVDLLAFIEREFGVHIADEDVLPENFATLRAIARLIEQLRQAA